MIRSIENGNFQKIDVFKYSSEELKKQLYFFANNENIISYAFVWYLFFITKKTIYHLYASNVTFGYFSFLSGSCDLAFFHYKAFLKNETESAALLEYLYLFYQESEIVMSSEEAKNICLKIFLLNPDSLIAKEWFGLIQESQKEKKLKSMEYLIEKNLFDESSKLIDDIALLTVFLLNVSSDKSILAYGLCWFLICKKESASLHVVAKKMIEVGFKDLTGASGIIFFHMYRAVELEPQNIEIIEQLLEMYELTPESFEPEETKLLAKKVLAQKPESKAALHVLGVLS